MFSMCLFSTDLSVINVLQKRNDCHWLNPPSLRRESTMQSFHRYQSQFQSMYLPLAMQVYLKKGLREIHTPAPYILVFHGQLKRSSSTKSNHKQDSVDGVFYPKRSDASQNSTQYHPVMYNILWTLQPYASRNTYRFNCRTIVCGVIYSTVCLHWYCNIDFFRKKNAYHTRKMIIFKVTIRNKV